MRVKFHLGRARRGEGEDKGRIKLAGQGAVGAEEVWRGEEWAREEVDRNKYMQSRSLSEGKTYRALEVSKASCAYEPKLIRMFWELVGNALASR